MKSPEIYLKENFHTGQLRHASIELTKYNLDIADFYSDQIRKIEPIPENCLPGLIIREALSPGHLKQTLRIRWEETEVKLMEFLRNLKFIQNPDATDKNIQKWFHHEPIFQTTREAKSFMEIMQRRLNLLLSEKTQKRLDAIKHAGYAYMESRVLKLAIFNGIYLARPYYN